jgi:hypothetical protein
VKKLLLIISIAVAFQVTVAAEALPTPELAGFPADQTVSAQRPDVIAKPVFTKLVTVSLSAR